VNTKRCAIDGVSIHCPLACSTCATDRCLDSPLKFNVEYNGKPPRAQVCDWVKSQQINTRCAIDGVKETCKETCDFCYAEPSSIPSTTPSTSPLPSVLPAPSSLPSLSPTSPWIDYGLNGHYCGRLASHTYHPNTDVETCKSLCLAELNCNAIMWGITHNLCYTVVGCEMGLVTFTGWHTYFLK